MRTHGKPIDVERMNQVLSYSPETGVLLWKSNFHKSRIGRAAGTINGKGYLVVKVDRQLYSAARLAWAMHYGNISAHLDIDHINRNRTDNRVSNLRLVSAAGNNTNRNNCYGEADPRYYTKHRTGRYQSQAGDKYLGLHDTPEAARTAAINHLKAMP